MESTVAPTDELILVALNADFDFHLEFHAGRVWIHNTVKNWNPGVFKRILWIVRELQARFGDLWVHDNDFDKAPNLPRYLALFGFKPAELWANDGMIRTAFVRRAGGADG